MDRREFMKLASLAGVSLVSPLGLGRAFAADHHLVNTPYEGLFFVTIHASGGWDPTSLCDPKGRANETDTDPMNMYFTGDIRTAGAIHYPPVERFTPVFEKYQQRLLVLNGVDTSTNGHMSGRRHIWSGNLAEGTPSLSALFAGSVAAGLPLTFISNGGYDYTADVVARTRIENVDALAKIAFPNRVDPNNASALFHSEETIGRIRAARKARRDEALEKVSLPKESKARSRLFVARQGENELRQLTAYLPDEFDNSNNPLKRQAQLAIASYKAGLTASATLVHGGFDTHGNHDAIHIPRLANVLEGMDFLMEEAERQGVADKLVVVIGSDFGRTPGYNMNNGKDHWSISSMMMMGPGIVGGRVIGSSDERHRALNINAQTLAQDESGLRLTPGSIHRALRGYLGIAEHPVLAPFRIGEPDLPLLG
jgi:hypothetical protein